MTPTRTIPGPFARAKPNNKISSTVIFLRLFLSRSSGFILFFFFQTQIQCVCVFYGANISDAEHVHTYSSRSSTPSSANDEYECGICKWNFRKYLHVNNALMANVQCGEKLTNNSCWCQFICDVCSLLRRQCAKCRKINNNKTKSEKWTRRWYHETVCGSLSTLIHSHKYWQSIRQLRFDMLQPYILCSIRKKFYHHFRFHCRFLFAIFYLRNSFVFEGEIIIMQHRHCWYRICKHFSLLFFFSSISWIE